MDKGLALLGRLWNQGCLGKGIIGIAVLIVLSFCGATGQAIGILPKPAPTRIEESVPQATAQPVLVPPVVQTPAATELPIPTRTPVPTQTLVPTFTPAPTFVLAGVAPKGGACPADHPVKGNIVDRGANKGERIYHTPDSPSYAATDPERCFVDAAEAEQAGYRPPR